MALHATSVSDNAYKLSLKKKLFFKNIIKGKLQTIFIILPWVVYKSTTLHTCKFGEFIVLTNRNNNTLENHERITLNKDYLFIYLFIHF